MSHGRLRIDTSVAKIAGPSSNLSSSHHGTASSSRLHSAKSTSHLRSASASSSTSIPSRALSSVIAQHTKSPSSASSSGSRGVNSGRCSPSGSEDDGTSGDYVLAMHDFNPQHQNVTCLAFRAGQVIHVLNRDPSGWWDGELDGRRGWFPSNYVTSDVGLLTDEELPLATQQTPSVAQGHTHTMSSVSTSSWKSTSSHRSNVPSRTDHRTDHRPIPTTSEAAVDSHCPPLMVPLLHGISLLQNAVRANRIAHFQPSTACIISCVRTMLSEIGCLPRDAPLLKQFHALAAERKRILSDLAALVTKAKKASEGQLSDEQRELEIESMVRLGGQLFAHVRGLLSVAVQCGIDVRPRSHGPTSAFGLSSSSRQGRWDSSDGTLVRSDESSTPLPGDYGEYWEQSQGTTNGIAQRRKQKDRNTMSSMRSARSMVDLRGKEKVQISTDVPLPKASAYSAVTPTTRILNRDTFGHRMGQTSISSLSSSSSFSSGESVGTPPTPLFPTGPSTTAEVMEALRQTHDHYLSTIAAFIGHAHSHSRMSHASSTGHMYDLVREVVEMVCKLLTIVEAVLRHPDIPMQKIQDLRYAKEGLYNVTSTLADSVRMLTSAPAPDVTEEEEKSTLLRSATNALKAGSDCVNAVKKCLQRSTGERPFIIELPDIGDVNAAIATPSKFSHQSRPSKSIGLREASSMNALKELYKANGIDGDDEDLTIQAQSSFGGDSTLKFNRPADEIREVEEQIEQETPPVQALSPMEVALPSTPAAEEPKTLPPLQMPQGPVEPGPSSPGSSLAPTDDGTTWEGSHRNHAPQSLEEKLLNGDLPAVPEGTIAEFNPDPLSWILSHDHAPEDVAYNSEGQLVGASLEALVERMTPHDSLVEPPFAAVFFLTFRQFTTPSELVDALIARYNIIPPKGIPEQDVYLWQQRKGLPVRLRVSNFVKSWLESYWRPSVDNVVLDSLLAFTRDALAHMFPVPSQRIVELIRQWQTASETGISPKVDRVRDAGIPLNPPTMSPSEIPRPIMTKGLLSALRNKNYTNIAITDFDPLELGRQLTWMECSLYCAIQPEEVLETGQKGGTYPGNVRAVTSLSTVITGWVAESILSELDTKKRTSLVKFFIKVADRCASLQNYSTPRSILAALDSSTISRLHQTWAGLPQKNKVQLETLRKLADHARNYHEYRSRLRNTAPPAVPFLGLYLTDITFCREGNPSHRAAPKNPEKKLLNFNKYHKLARIVQDMQRFQVHYNLKAIPEVQDYLKDAFEKSKHDGDLQDLYRRSLLVEPKQPADTPPASDVRQLFGWTTRSQAVTPTTAS
ncbi:ras guanine nucleotide exchange factor domain-containing protein [Abortiporus biennis]|nr:ras guanine nucleotide exchange factor domain-containing protein [Abortiporus biennis]